MLATRRAVKSVASEEIRRTARGVASRFQSGRFYFPLETGRLSVTETVLTKGIRMYTKSWRSLVCVVAVFTSTYARASDPIVVAEGARGQAPKQPQAAVTADGTAHLVYGAGDAVFHSRSTDGAETFSPPREAFRVSNLSLGMRRGPRIAVAGKVLVVTAIGGLQGRGRDGDLQAWRSTDGGETWTGPVPVNDVADSAREGLHGLASGSDGSVWSVWLDLREKRSEVYSSKSNDGGETWKSNVLVYRSPDGNVCECCHPSVMVGDGAVHVMFRNSLAGNRDMYVATSTDEGATFGPATKIGQGAWKLNACPMDGGMLAQRPNGSLVAVWRRNGEVFSTSSIEGKEQMLARGQQPWVAATASGAVIVWTDGREGNLWVQRPGTRQPQKLSAAARDPMVATAIGGAGPVVTCWESKRDGKSLVLATRIDADKHKSP